MIKFLGSLLSGLIAAPISLLWIAFVSIATNAMYDEIVAPIAGLYGYELPDVPFWQWIAFGLLVLFFNTITKGMPDKKMSNDEQAHAFLVRVAGIIAIWASAHIINWIWL